MKAVILTGGNPPEKPMLAGYLKNSQMLIGVDGAADTLFYYDIAPDVLVGDFDTADEMHVRALESAGAEVLRLMTEKNETDTEAALHYAISCGAEDIVILGAIGSRFDHTLANVYLLITSDMAGVQCRIINELNEMYVTCRDTVIQGRVGQVVSLLPLGGDVVVSASGLKYPLDNLTLTPSKSRGISNIMEETTAALSISGGYVLIIKTDNAA